MALKTWHIGTLDSCDKTAEKDTAVEYTSFWYKGTDSGTQQNDIKISLDKDGSMFFSEIGSEGFIYLYPEQIAHLEKLLALRKEYLSHKEKA